MALDLVDGEIFMENVSSEVWMAPLHVHTLAGSEHLLLAADRVLRCDGRAGWLAG